MRILYGALVLLVLATSAQAADWRGPIDCSRPDGEPETTICRNPALRAEDAAIAGEYDKLLDSYAQPEHDIFMEGQAAWVIEQALRCRAPSVAADYPNGIEGCAKATMDERLAFLRKLREDPSMLIATAPDYDFVSPWYVRQFAKQYEGRTLHIIAAPLVAGCHVPSVMQVHDDLEMKIEFASITRKQSSYLCRKKPYIRWTAMVKLDQKGEPYLYVSDLSGVRFP